MATMIINSCDTCIKNDVCPAQDKRKKLAHDIHEVELKANIAAFNIELKCGCYHMQIENPRSITK